MQINIHIQLNICRNIHINIHIKIIIQINLIIYTNKMNINIQIKNIYVIWNTKYEKYKV